MHISTLMALRKLEGPLAELDARSTRDDVCHRWMEMTVDPARETVAIKANAEALLSFALELVRLAIKERGSVEPQLMVDDDYDSRRLSVFLIEEAWETD